METYSLPKNAKEGSTYIIEVEILDKNRSKIVPTTLYWTLVDFKGNIINNRVNIPFDNISNINYVILQGNDLTPGWRYLTVEGLYDSIHGENLPVVQSVEFYVE